MIPILYERDETAFASNGLGRLRDCTRCEVTEERNGIYEVEFDYPTNGQNFDKIQIGRIIAIEHDDSGDVQPFDIVGYTKPIDGVVTFRANHISYRQSGLTVTGSNINSLADALTLLKNSATPSNPFTYWTDKTSVGYVAVLDGVPKTVRSVLGGTEGSILDTFGGEYEWDRFDVRLHSQRGQLRDFAIRYGVNMTDYNEEADGSASYQSVIPYWTDGTTTIVGDKQTGNGHTVTGRDETVPLDVSEKFEEQPTKAQVNAMGLSVLNSNNPALPTQNISVSFVRLQDAGEFEMFSNLMKCGLCDSIQVIFPDYNSSGTFKIVKTVWDVLGERYDSMELGDLSVSLSEALGISDVQRDSKSTIEQIIDKLETVSTPSISITATTGTLSSYIVRQWCNVVALQVVFQTAGSVASGSNCFVGTVNTAGLRPAVTANTGSYYGAHALNGSIDSSGKIIIRNASTTAVSVTGANTAGASFIYLVE